MSTSMANAATTINTATGGIPRLPPEILYKIIGETLATARHEFTIPSDPSQNKDAAAADFSSVVYSLGHVNLAFLDMTILWLRSVFEAVVSHMANAKKTAAAPGNAPSTATTGLTEVQSANQLAATLFMQVRIEFLEKKRVMNQNRALLAEVRKLRQKLRE